MAASHRPIQCQIETQHIDAGLAEEAEVGGVGVVLDQRAHLLEAQATGFGYASGLEFGVLQLIWGSSPLAEPVTASAGTGALVARPFWAR